MGAHRATALCLALTLCATDVAAGVPEMEDLLVGRARDEYFGSCPDASTVGAACQGTICGADFTLDPGGGPGPRVMTIDGTAFDLHSTTAPVDLSVADLINARCSDALLASAGPTALHSSLLAEVSRRIGTARGAHGRSEIAVGGALELGPDTKGVQLPFAYARSLSPTLFANATGSFAYASRPESSHVALAALPSIGTIVESPSVGLAFGAYAPLSFASTTFGGIDDGRTTLVGGVGGIGTFETDLGRVGLAGGLAAAGRFSDAGATVPVTATVTATHPLAVLVDAFAAASLGLDPLNSGTTVGIVGAGVAVGDFDIGYRAIFATGYLAHVLGATFRKELEGSFAVAPPPAEPAPASDTAEPPATQPPRPAPSSPATDGPTSAPDAPAPDPAPHVPEPPALPPESGTPAEPPQPEPTEPPAPPP